MEENNYLPFQEINKNIKKLFQDRHQKNILLCKDIVSLFISLQEILFHLALEALLVYYLNWAICLFIFLRAKFYLYSSLNYMYLDSPYWNIDWSKIENQCTSQKIKSDVLDLFEKKKYAMNDLRSCACEVI